MKYIYTIIAFLFLIGCIAFQCKEINRITEDRNIYKQNTTTLLKDLERYKIDDSLNVVSLSNLKIELSEYKKYRADDYRVIESMKVDKKRLEQVTTAQTQTIYKLQGAVRDSIVYVEKYIIDTLKCISIYEKWFDLTGCILNNQFLGEFVSRDSIVYIEHIVPKRFWFIKWGVKERRQEIVSKNQHTEITGAEYITIKR